MSAKSDAKSHSMLFVANSIVGGILHPAICIANRLGLTCSAPMLSPMLSTARASLTAVRKWVWGWFAASPRNPMRTLSEADALPCSYTKPNSSCRKPDVSTVPVHLSGKLAAKFNACLKRERRRAAFPCGAVPNGRTLIEGFRQQ